MCGIAGEVAVWRDRQVNASNVLTLASALAHRGPDDWGYYLAADRRAVLVHARLSIVDIGTGRQPLCNEDGTIWVICNGELYGFKAQRRQLEAAGHRFSTNSDSELIVHLYEEYGDAFVDHLRGEFAIALWDQRHRRMYLVRDRFGVKPLFYTMHNGCLQFASEMKALFVLPGCAAQIDPDQLWHAMGTVMPPTGTLFRGVHQIEPGSWARIDSSGVTLKTYWDYEDRRRARASELAALPHETRAELFLEGLTEAVRLRLQADVEVGAYLSGGIDSGSLVALASQLGQRDFKCFTIGLPGRFDESAAARRLTDEMGIDWRLLTVTEADLAGNFEQSVWHCESPVPNAHGTAKLLLSRFAGSDVKVVLTGEGADELLGGYAHFAHMQMLEQAHSGDPRAAAGLRRPRGSATTGLVRGRDFMDHDAVVRQLGAYPYAALRNRAYRGKARALLAPQWRERFRNTDSLGSAGVSYQRMLGLSSLDATAYFGIKTELPNYMLSNLGDRQEMAHGIEGRVPFLDHVFAEVAGAMPWDEKLGDGGNKRLLREVMRQMGGDAWQIPKKVFLAPSLPGLSLHRPGALAHTYLSRAAIRDAGLFDPGRVAALRALRSLAPENAFRRGVADNALTFVLSVQILHRQFCEDFAGSAARYGRAARLRLADGDMIRQMAVET